MLMLLGPIKSYVLSCNTYSTIIEDYVVPSYVVAEDGFSRINVLSNRTERINSTKSSYEESFLHDLQILTGKAKSRKPALKRVIREFPIVIDDRDLWENILKTLDAPKEYKAWGRKFFMLDFFFPMADFIVEIDSNFHIGLEEELYDKARDIYLSRRYGLQTARYMEYGLDPVTRDAYKKDFENKISKNIAKKERLNCRAEDIHLDFTDIIVKNYINENKDALSFIDKLRKSKDTDFLLTGVEKLKVKSQTIIDLGYDITDILFKNLVIGVLWNLFRIEIIFLTEKKPPKKP